MSTTIQPLADYVVAQAEEAESKTASGLYLPEQAKGKSAIAKVVAVGPDIKGLKEGDRIIFKQYSPTNVTIDREEFLLVKEEDILAKVK